MNLSKLSEILNEEPKFRFAQANKALFQDFISSWDEVSNFPKNLRERLNLNCPIEIKAELIGAKNAKSLKALIELIDGEKIETVLIRQRTKEGTRNTVCLSSQVGCALACSFCATGDFGFRRNLDYLEIIEQVLFWARFLKDEAGEEKIDNIVFMGMGEPFLNYDEFLRAAKFLNNEETFNFAARRLSVSTSGIVEGIKKIAGEKLQINLAISLHTADENLRKDLMPIAKKYSIREILKAVDNYILKSGRRVMFEYLMLKNINDSDKDALALAKIMRKPLYMVNLIPYNPTGRFQASSPERMEKFKKILEENQVPVTLRHSAGAELSAACGQLRGRRS
ncbi:23S rRNA (adenine(2503)-C(2))-methyltransferase RlmN [Patescibacteria group bacterium]|nr:23S rRNA (adenine(2503)-C(2))-methyltransferase RlmN [Patescibacteria group bacterium]